MATMADPRVWFAVRRGGAWSADAAVSAAWVTLASLEERLDAASLAAAMVRASRTVQASYDRLYVDSVVVESPGLPTAAAREPEPPPAEWVDGFRVVPGSRLARELPPEPVPPGVLAAVERLRWQREQDERAAVERRAAARRNLKKAMRARARREREEDRRMDWLAAGLGIDRADLERRVAFGHLPPYRIRHVYTGSVLDQRSEEP